MYGDPHIEQTDGTSYTHQGQGEYQLLALPELTTEIHYYGCGVTAERKALGTMSTPDGTYIGALAIKIGLQVIEIVGNDLYVAGSSGKKYEIDYANDKSLGPYTLNAGNTMITIEREGIITADKLNKAQGSDKKRLDAGGMLYRWTIYTAHGFILHSHASKFGSAEGGFVLDVHISYDKDKAGGQKGLCCQDCESSRPKEYNAGNGTCSELSACHQIIRNNPYGIDQIFTNETTKHMQAICPGGDKARNNGCAPPPVDDHDECLKTGIPYSSALEACSHLSLLSDNTYHEACTYDVCSGATNSSSFDWFEEHNPASTQKCKVVSDPRFTTYSGYKFGFAGTGYYSVVEKKLDASGCNVEIQTLECSAPCTGKGPQSPGDQCGRSYVQAIGIMASGERTSEITFTTPAVSKKVCMFDGDKCKGHEDAEYGENLGKRGIKIYKYTPVEGVHPYMGEYGVGSTGFYVYASGFAINITMTSPSSDVDALNMIVSAPDTCLLDASGLCTLNSNTTDAKIQAYHNDYMMRLAKKTKNAAALKGDELRLKSVLAMEGDHQDLRSASVLMAPQDFEQIEYYPSLDATTVMENLGTMSCPGGGKKVVKRHKL
jgi:hypothetical protein